MTTNSLAKAFADSDREFWHGVLTGGGFTPIPRWTLDPVPGVAVCDGVWREQRECCHPTEKHPARPRQLPGSRHQATMLSADHLAERERFELSMGQ